MRGKGTRVEVVTSKGCSRLLAEITTSMSSFRGGIGFQSYAMESVSHLSTASRVDELAGGDKCNGPFSGLVICVTGLSKEARKQVMAATERLGGEYSPHLHPQCTHLVVQSFHGRKFEHALKHGPKNGLSVVTLGWFVDSVRRNVRLSESLYGVKSGGDGGVAVDDLKRLLYDSGTEKSCLPFGSHECTDRSYPKGPRIHFPERDSKRISMSLPLSGYSFYIDADVSAELRTKVVEAATAEGAIFVDQWYVGCSASHVVCEGPSVRKYLGHSNNIVTPLWVLKTARGKCVQRLVHISADLARQTAMTIDFIQTGTCKEEDGGTVGRQGGAITALNTSHEERQKIANLAKDRVRKRRNFHMQTCESPILSFTPNSLLDSICWSISEPTSSATIYTESLNMVDANGQDAPVFFDAKSDEKESEASFINLSRPLTESEKSESIFKNHFLTILFPVDRFYEMGPRSRTFFSDKGFTCLQVLEYIYDFYQENMPADEIEVAIHTDSRHADRLRSMFSSEATAERGYFEFMRIDFLGSRKSFEMLKRVSVDNNSNVYELLIRA